MRASESGLGFNVKTEENEGNTFRILGALGTIRGRLFTACGVCTLIRKAMGDTEKNDVTHLFHYCELEQHFLLSLASIFLI